MNTEAHPLPIRGKNLFHRGVKLTTKAPQAHKEEVDDAAVADDAVNVGVADNAV